MTKRLHTEASVRELAKGSELVLGPNEIATPAALELAFARGIRVRWSDAAAAPAAAATTTSTLWKTMLGADGQYVVEVAGGRARVFRLAAGGPVLVGEGS